MKKQAITGFCPGIHKVQNWCKTKNINFIEYPNNGVIRNLDK